MHNHVNTFQEIVEDTILGNTARFSTDGYAVVNIRLELYPKQPRSQILAQISSASQEVQHAITLSTLFVYSSQQECWTAALRNALVKRRGKDCVGSYPVNGS